MGIFGKKSSSPRMTEQGWQLPPSSWKEAVIKGPGTFAQEVMGESFYDDNLHEIMNDNGINSIGPHPVGLAFLFPEPLNKFDPNAIAVVIDRKQVGHIPKDDTAFYHALLKQLGDSGQYPLVEAQLYLGSEDRIGISLDFDVVEKAKFFQGSN